MKPFGYYKKSIDSILESSYTDKNLFKENFHIIMGAMKLSKDFREFFTLYNEFESPTLNENNLEQYINESIDYLRPKIKNIKMVCNVLDKVFAKRKNLIKLTENKIYDNLDYLVFKTGVKTLNKRIVTKKQLVENIKSKKTTNKLDTVLSPKVLAYSLSENFNKQFSGLNKEEKELISEIITLKTEDLDKNFIENKDSVIVKINKLVKESDDDNLITRLIETKNKVITMNSSKLSLLKLKQLKNDLNY
tara:strand:- start:697 stop:1440 length:744 start_codon:yes stop_codon:yes gene_type:complete